MRVAITGNSNSGKTTLFNALTKSSLKTGNWHGVTVDIAQKAADFFGQSVEVVDVPGLTSLDFYSLEEGVAAKYLSSKDFDVLVFVLECAAFLQSVKLLRELSALGRPIVVFMNFYGELKRSGGNIDYQGFSKVFGAQVVVGEAINADDVLALKKAILQAKTSVYHKNFNAEKFFTAANFKLGKLDKLLLSKKWLFPISALFLLLSFYLAFGNYGVGKFLSQTITWLVELLACGVDYLLTRLGVAEFLCGLITEGIIGGIGSVLAFIPQIAVLNLCLIILEQTGVISRISFLSDNALSKIGVSGRAVYALIMGFGCTAVAVTLSGGMESKSMRQRLLMALPLLPCSARTPIIMYLANICFARFAFLVLFAIYSLGMVFSLIFLRVLTRLDREPAKPMLLELPRLRGINAQNTLKPLIKSLKEFIIKITTVITLVSVAIYLAKSFSFGGELLSDARISESILGSLGECLKFLFAPIKLARWDISTSFLTGLFAKEAILSTLHITGADGIALTVSQGLALIMFAAFYTPCTVAVECMRRNGGIKLSCISALFQLVFALAVCYATYYFMESALFRGVIAAALAILLILKLVLKIRRNENYHGKNRRKTL